MDWTWVDAGLSQLGLKLDLTAAEVPLVARPTYEDAVITVDRVMKALPAIYEMDLKGEQLKSTQDNWSVEVSTIPGNKVVSCKTLCNHVKGFDKDDFLKLAVDDAMIQITSLWDETFVQGSFTHIITKDGRAFANGTDSVAGLPAQDVAKIMCWVFRIPGMPVASYRQIVSVYVTYVDKSSIFATYLPVQGDLFPIPKGNKIVRAKLLVPCVDRAIYEEDGTMCFEHYITATMKGWFPNAMVNSYVGRRKMLTNAREEARSFLNLFIKSGWIGEAFNKVQRKDGTSFI